MNTVGNEKKIKKGTDGHIFVTRKQIYDGLDKYSCQVKDIDHIIASAYQENDTYNFDELIRKLKPVYSNVSFVELHEEELKKTSPKEDDEDVEYM